MGALARALRAKFPGPGGPRQALKMLGLPEDLIDIKQLAKDSKLKRGRDGMVDGAEAEEMRAARNFSGSAFEDEQLRINRKMEHEMADDDEEELEAAENDTDARRRQVRRMSMGFAARDCLERGMSHDEVREYLESVWPMPENATEGGMGGRLAGDDEEAAALAEDINVTMKALEQMGGSATSEYEDEDMLQSKDKKRMARDAALARDSFAKMYPDAARLDGSDMSHCFGDRLAMDATVADGDGSFEAWFGASRIGIA